MKKRAFTLIELLVVLSIIVMLMALLLPQLGKAKAKSAQIECSSKMRSLGQGLAFYFAEWNATVPTNGLLIPKSGLPAMYQGTDGYSLRVQAAEAKFPNQWRLEFGALWTELGGVAYPPNTPLPLPATPESMAKRFICKTDYPTMLRTYASGSVTGTKPLYLQTPPGGGPPVVMEGSGTPIGWAPGYWSYSVNSVLNSLGRFRDRFQYLSTPGDPTSLGGISLPWSDPFKQTSMRYNNDSQFITFIEEDNASLFNDEVFDAPAYNGGDFLTNRHNFGGNVAFLDGHVDPYKATEFNYVPTALNQSTGFIDNQTAMQSPITRMFFPDGGTFAAYGQ